MYIVSNTIELFTLLVKLKIRIGRWHCLLTELHLTFLLLQRNKCLKTALYSLFDVFSILSFVFLQKSNELWLMSFKVDEALPLFS